MANIIIDVSQRPIFNDCVTLSNNVQTLNISQGADTSNLLLQELVYSNSCKYEFSTESKTVRVEGITVSVPGATIRNNSQVKVTPTVRGAYEGTNDKLSAVVELGEEPGTTFNLTFLVNRRPVTNDIVKTVKNRESYYFTKEDFTSAFSDLDGDTITAVRLAGPQENLQYFKIRGGSTVVLGQEIPIGEINNLYFTAPNSDNDMQIVLRYDVKDEKGNWSKN